MTLRSPGPHNQGRLIGGRGNVGVSVIAELRIRSASAVRGVPVGVNYRNKPICSIFMQQYGHREARGAS
jgi:hypothetical protein